jgi:hypothetical protein
MIQSGSAKFSLFLLFILLSFKFYSQNVKLSDSAKISVLTCDTGNESYSLFGHTALRICDSIQDIDVVYNYGGFDFNTPNFILKFAKGDLIYFATVHHYLDFINQYNQEQKTVYQQELILSTSESQKVFDNLNESLRSGESQYQYKFIDKNCTTMLIDIINKSVSNDFISEKTENILSYREILFPYFENHFYERLGTSILFGTKVDQLGDHIFLPFQLKETLEHKSNYPIVKQSIKIIDYVKQTEKSIWNNWYTYILLFVLIIFFSNITRKVYFAILGLLGLLLLFMGFYSLHHELHNNYNVLLFSPLYLLLLFFYVTKNSKYVKIFIWILAVFNMIYLFIMLNKIHLLLVSPIWITSMYLLFRLYIENKSITKPSL